MSDTPYSVDLTNVDQTVLSAHLKMGGDNPAGRRIDVNSRYWLLDGRPWLPVMGEFHYARYPHQRWREELLKIKAGGVNIVSTYIFWIHHEEIENAFDWSGDRDLRRFVELCAQVGLLSYPRIGPWCHGECRNGGFPDWLLKECGKEVRKDTPLYLAYVRRLYRQIAQQLEALWWKDGGPIVGIQFDNELRNNPAHLLTLKTMARDAGMDAPLYTATGWGAVEVPEDEIIPLFGGYADASWDRQTGDWSRDARRSFQFSHLRDEYSIGSDLQPITGNLAPRPMGRYPYGTCELGAGMNASYHRRPVIAAEDTAALTLTKIGSGCNLVGYFMYHGGLNPAGKLTTLQESHASGYPNDLPVVSNDYQAPIGEFGQIRPSYHLLRSLHMFLNDFGRDLAPLPMVLPDRQPSGWDDRQTLRWAVRSDGRRGYLFINNHQRIESLPEHRNVQFRLALKDDARTIPSSPTTIPAQRCMIWPINMDLAGVRLRHSTAQPLCRIDLPDSPCFVFFAPDGVTNEFAFDEGTTLLSSDHPVHSGEPLIVRNLFPGTAGVLRLRSPDGKQAMILLLTQEQAMSAWKGPVGGAERLILWPGGLVIDNQTLRLRPNATNASLAIFPGPASLKTDSQPLPMTADGIFARYALPPGHPASILHEPHPLKAPGPARIVSAPGPRKVASAPLETDWQSAGVWHVAIPAELFRQNTQLLLRIDYIGDVARAYAGDRLIADNFYSGQAWEIGLNDLSPDLPHHGLTLKILPLRKDAPIYLPPTARPDFGDREDFLALRTIQAHLERNLTLTFDKDS